MALLGYGVMVQNCLKAQSLLAELNIQVTVVNARFCKPLDIELVRKLCREHEFLITVEEGSIGGFGSHVAQFIALDGLLDGRTKVNIFLVSEICCLPTTSILSNLLKSLLLLTVVRTIITSREWAIT